MAKRAKFPVIHVRRSDEIPASGGLPAYLSVEADQMKKSLPCIPEGRAIVGVPKRSQGTGAAENAGRTREGA
jgi:hypothetical protein